MFPSNAITACTTADTTSTNFVKGNSGDVLILTPDFNSAVAIIQRLDEIFVVGDTGG